MVRDVLVLKSNCCMYVSNTEEKQYSAYVVTNINGVFVVGDKAELLKRVWPVTRGDYLFSFVAQLKDVNKQVDLVVEMIRYCQKDQGVPITIVLPQKFYYQWKDSLESAAVSLKEDWNFVSSISFMTGQIDLSIKQEPYLLSILETSEGYELLLAQREGDSFRSLKEVFVSKVLEQMALEKVIKGLYGEYKLSSEHVSMYVSTTKAQRKWLSAWGATYTEINENTFTVRNKEIKKQDNGYKEESTLNGEKLLEQIVSRIDNADMYALFTTLMKDMADFGYDVKTLKKLIFLAKQAMTEQTIAQEDIVFLKNLFLMKYEETVKIGMVSPFTYGKSTLLNGLLGYPLLKEDIRAETAIVTSLTYAPNFSYCYQSKGVIIAKRVQTFFELQEALSELTSVRGKELNIQHVQVTLPFDSFYQNIEWVDTPGLYGPHSHHDVITKSVLEQFNMIVFLVDPNKAGFAPYTEMLHDLYQKLSSRFLFVLTKADMYRSGMDDAIREFQQVLAEELRHIKIIPVSGYLASRARAFQKSQLTLDDLQRDRNIILEVDGALVLGPLIKESHAEVIEEESNIYELEIEINRQIRNWYRAKREELLV